MSAQPHYKPCRSPGAKPCPRWSERSPYSVRRGSHMKWRLLGRIVAGALGLAVVLSLVLGFWFWRVLAGSVAQLEGEVTLPGLQAPVEIKRDSAGVPTVTAASRQDLARALGFLHGQERYFQMDTV